MLKINFVTLFPEVYNLFINHSIIKRAIARGLVKVNVVDWRLFAKPPHYQVDDVSYGGGEGMVLMLPPLVAALQTLGGRKILMSPQGKTFDQEAARRLAKENEITLIAGHYEDFDTRIVNYIDEELSIGDFVVTGGELPSMLVADAVARLVPEVIKANSHANDSFTNDLLDYPHYTKPREFEGLSVPEVLLGGNHAAINAWRLEEQKTRTKTRRPDLWARRNKDAK